MNDLIVYIAKVLNQIEQPTSLEKTEKAREQAARAYDILQSYRGHPEVILEALEAFIKTNCLHYYLGGAAHVMIETSYLSRMDYDADGLVIAQDYIQKARAIDNENFYAEYANAKIYSIKNILPAEQIALNKAGVLPEAQENCYFARSYAYYYWKTYNDKRFREWRDRAKSYVKNDKQRIRMQFAYAQDLAAEGQISDAIRAYQQIEKLCQDDPWYFVNVAGLLMEINELDKAEEYVQRSLSIMDFGMARHIESQIKERRSWLYQLKRFFTGTKYR